MTGFHCQLANERWQPQADVLLFATCSDYFAPSDLARAKDVLVGEVGLVAG